MIIAVICFAIALILLCREWCANHKQKKINKIKQQIHMPLNNSAIKDATVMGVASVGLSLFDIYVTIDKHEDVLDVLEQRFPKAHGSNDMWDWFEHISSNLADNADSMEGYVSCFKGQAAENISLQLLRDKGLDANLFDSLTNETNDIYVNLGNGAKELYSVKCGDTSYVKQCIENSDATNFIVNSESYMDLDRRGLLDVYERQGINIINGNFSDDQLTYMAENAFEEIGDAGDVTETIPYVALACLGFKTYNNIKNLSEGKQNTYETVANIEMDVLKVGAAGVLAGFGSEIGAYVGSMILPGVGTIIGAGIGVVGGALMSSSLFEWGKERLKWGKIIDAQDYFGENFKKKFSYYFCQNAVDKCLKTSKFKETLKREEEIRDKYKNELNPYKIKSVTVSAVLVDEYYNSLKSLEGRIRHTRYNLGDRMVEVCNSCVRNLEESKRETFSRRLLGELVICNSDCIGGIDNVDRNYLNGYREQKVKASNYPYRFSKSPSVVLEDIVKQTFNSIQPKAYEEKKGVLNRFLIILFCGLGLFFGIKDLNKSTIIVPEAEIEQDVETESEMIIQTVIVPDFVGMTWEQMREIADSEGIYIRIENYEYSNEYELDEIMSQYPEEGTEVEKGETIYIVLSLGKEPISVPNLYGYTIEEAKIMLESMDLQLGEQIGSTFTVDAIKSKIGAQSIKSGTEVERGTIIDYEISLGRPGDLDLERIRQILSDSYTVDMLIEEMGLTDYAHSRPNSHRTFVRFGAFLSEYNGEWEYYQEDDEYCPQFICWMENISKDELETLLLNLGAQKIEYGFLYENMYIQIEHDYYYPEKKHIISFVVFD